MKSFAFGIAAAAVIGFASLAAPASAATVTQTSTVQTHAAPVTDFSAARYVKRSMVHRGPRCTVRTVIKRGPHGRRVVNKVRVCR